MTAFLAASVIGLFEATIQQIVALAVLMPIVAGMGGNAGSQTMTVTVRALATRDLDIHNAWRIVRREAGVGLLNGLLFGVLIGVVAGAWFQDHNIGGIIAAAMLINMIAAALAGHHDSAAARSFRCRSGRLLGGFRHDGDRCDRIFRFSRARNMVVSRHLMAVAKI